MEVTLILSGGVIINAIINSESKFNPFKKSNQIQSQAIKQSNGIARKKYLTISNG